LFSSIIFPLAVKRINKQTKQKKKILYNNKSGEGEEERKVFFYCVYVCCGSRANRKYSTLSCQNSEDLNTPFYSSQSSNEARMSGE
jgi:hypothetical protein